jgi:hypothetical protein
MSSATNGYMLLKNHIDTALMLPNINVAMPMEAYPSLCIVIKILGEYWSGKCGEAQR